MSYRTTGQRRAAGFRRALLGIVALWPALGAAALGGWTSPARADLTSAQSPTFRDEHVRAHQVVGQRDFGTAHRRLWSRRPPDPDWTAPLPMDVPTGAPPERGEMRSGRLFVHTIDGWVLTAKPVAAYDDAGERRLHDLGWRGRHRGLGAWGVFAPNFGGAGALLLEDEESRVIAEDTQSQREEYAPWPWDNTGPRRNPADEELEELALLSKTKSLAWSVGESKALEDIYFLDWPWARRPGTNMFVWVVGPPASVFLILMVLTLGGNRKRLPAE